MKKILRNRRILFLSIFFMGILSISLGYAYLKSRLSINGSTTISQNSWIIYFDNIVESDNNVEAVNVATIDDNKTKVSFDVNFLEAQDTYEFNVDIVNDGTIDAQIDSIVKTDLTKEQKQYLDYVITYDDGTRVRKCDVLPHDSKKTLLVKVKLKDGKEYVYGDQEDLDLGFEVNYIQNGDSCELDEETNHTLTINPNGGVYNGTTSLVIDEYEKDDEILIGEVTYDGYTFEGWSSNVDGVYNSDTHIVTMGEQDIILTAEWSFEESEAVARIGEVLYPTIQAAFNKAVDDDTIYLLKNTSESPVNRNANNIKLDLSEFTVNGMITNKGNLALSNGKIVNDNIAFVNQGTLLFTDGIIESTNNAGFINNGTLTMGINDDVVNIEDCVKILGKTIGLENNSVFNFFDGYIEAKVGLKGSYNDVPSEYTVYVEHVISNDYQKVYLVTIPSNAVAKTLDEYNKPLWYNNLQDAFNTAMESDKKLPVYAIRDFEAAYNLFISEGEDVDFDLAGYVVSPGELITNDGTFTIKDSGRTIDGDLSQGKLYPSKTIQNNGVLKIVGSTIEQSTAANVITNDGTIYLDNANIIAKNGYGIYNEGEGIIDGQNENIVTATNYAIYNVAEDGFIDCHIKTLGTGVVYNINKLTLSDDAVLQIEKSTNANRYGVYNYGANSKLYINGAKINADSTYSSYSLYGVYLQNSSSIVEMNSGEIVVGGLGHNYGIFGSSYGTFTMNGGVIDVSTSSNSEVYGIYSKHVIINDGIVKVTNTSTNGCYGIRSGTSYEINGGEVIISSSSTSTSYYSSPVALYGSGTVNNDSLITSSHICAYSGNITINGGTFNCGTYGVDLYGNCNLTMNGGTINSRLDGVYMIYGSTSSPRATIVNGTIISREQNGVYYKPYGNSSYLTIGSTDNTSFPYIEGATNGIYNDYASSSIDYGHITINKGKIIGKSLYGLYTVTNCDIGINDDNVSTDNPIILGNTYGLYVQRSVTNFYDGILKGQSAGYFGTISGLSDGTNIATGTEEIDQILYNTAYLDKYINFVKVGDVEYNSLNKAINAIETTGTLEIIKSAEIKSDVQIPAEKNITLNLADFTLNVSKQIKNSGTFTVIDTSDENLKEGKITCGVEYCLYNIGTMTLSGGTITNNYAAIYNTKNLIINEGVYIDLELNSSNAQTYGIYNYGSGYSSKAYLTINGGTIDILNNGTSYGVDGVYKNDYSVVTINGGNISVTSQNTRADGVSNNHGSIDMTGGKISVSAKYGSGLVAGTVNFTGGEVTVTATDTNSSGIYGISSSNYRIDGGTINLISSNNKNHAYTAAIQGKGTINNNPVITSSNNCLKDSVTINGGTFTCGGYGIYAVGATIVINSGNINSFLDGVYGPRYCGSSCTYSGNFTINGGVIKSTNGYGVRYYGGNSYALVIGNMELSTYPYIEGTTAVYFEYGNMKVNKAEFVGTTDYGIYTDSFTNIGVDDADVMTSLPIIRGAKNGLYIDGGTINIYDGIFKGKQGAVNGFVSGMADGYSLVTGSEMIDEENYETSYLDQSEDFVKVLDVTYNSLNKALEAIESEGAMELIASANIKTNFVIPINKNVTLDLAGYSLNLSKEITNNGSLKIIDSSTEATGGITCTLEYCLVNNENMNISGGNYNVDYNFIKNTKNLTINDGTNIYGKAYRAIFNTGSSAKITINGGTISLENVGSNGGGIVYSDNANSIVNINGGNLSVTGSNAYAISGGTSSGIVNITGGSIYVEGDSYTFGVYAKEVNMSGGKVTANNTLASGSPRGHTIETSTFNISGGTIELNSILHYDGYYSDLATIKGGGLITGDAVINSTNGCVKNYNSPLTVSGGTLTCGRFGIDTYNANLNVTGGTIKATEIAIDASRDGNAYPKLITITGGNIESSNNYGVYYHPQTSSSILTLGVKDGSIDTASPSIKGLTYGLYIGSGVTNFYDGILKGKTDAYYGAFNNIEDNSLINVDVEMIDELSYNTAYLINQTDIVRNNNMIDNNTYTNLQTAIDEANSGDTLELIDNAPVFYELTIPSGKTINIKTMGYSITTSKSIVNNGVLNIVDGSSEKTSKINCSLGIDLITNNGTLNITDVDINYSLPTYNISILVNNGSSLLTNVSMSKGYYGIKNNDNGVLTLNDSDVYASNTAIYNTGEFHIDGGTISGDSYTIYERTVKDDEIKNATISSASSNIYKYQNGSTLTITDSDLLVGNITNLVGTINIIGGTISGVIDNKAIMSIDGSTIEKHVTSSDDLTAYTYRYSFIRNVSNLTISNINMNITADSTNFSIIYSNNTLNINGSIINGYTSSNYNDMFNAIHNNGGVVTLSDNEITMEDNSGRAVLSNNYYLYINGIYNENGGSFTSSNDSIIVKNGKTNYGIYNDSAESNNMINNITVNLSGAANGYGVYNNNGAITIEDGNIEVSALNAYGMYIGGLGATTTLGVMDGSGLETASVSTVKPIVKAIGTDSGIGVKKVDGSFDFYDGKIIGSTYAKPDTTNLVEPRFEARFYVVDSDNNETRVVSGTEENYDYEYEYCILEYQG